MSAHDACAQPEPEGEPQDELVVELDGVGDAAEQIPALDFKFLQETLNKIKGLEDQVRKAQGESDQRLKALLSIRDELLALQKDAQKRVEEAKLRNAKLRARIEQKRKQVLQQREQQRFASPPPKDEPEPKQEAAPEAPAQSIAPTMDRGAFHSLLRLLEGQANDAQRLQMLRNDPRRYWLNAQQVFHLLLRHNGDETRLQALQALAPRLMDPQNARAIYPAFDSMRNRYRARSVIVRSLDLTTYPSAQQQPPQSRRVRRAR